MFIFDKMKIVSFISLLLLCVLSHEFVSANQNHADDWIDPLDMVNFDPTLNKMKYKVSISDFHILLYSHLLYIMMQL